MKVLSVPDMHCEKCIERISNALKTANIAFEISLTHKTVSVEEDKVLATIEELDDLGFEVKE